MKRILVGSVISFIVGAWVFHVPPSASPPKREVFLAAGQSNMDGRVSPSELPFMPAMCRVQRWGADGGWETGGEPWNKNGTVYEVLNEAAGDSQAGPILAFADRLAAIRPGDATVSVVSATRGATGLDQWSRNLDRKTLYGAMIDRVRKALDSSGGHAQLKGVFWYQGESDAMVTELAEAWPAKFNQFVTDLRNDLGAPNLPIVFVVLGPDPGTPMFPAWKALQHAQRTMPLPHNVVRVSAADLESASNSPHLTAASAAAIGRRAADALNNLIGPKS